MQDVTASNKHAGKKAQLSRNKHISTSIHICAHKNQQRTCQHKDQRINTISNQQKGKQDSSFAESLVLFLVWRRKVVFTERRSLHKSH